jgi:hypothetical protein
VTFESVSRSVSILRQRWPELLIGVGGAGVMGHAAELRESGANFSASNLVELRENLNFLIENGRLSAAGKPELLSLRR